MENWIILLVTLMALVSAACALRIWILTAELGRERRMGIMKSAIIRNLSKEIRTPLQSMSRQADIISREDIFLSKDEKNTISGQMTYNVSLISTLLDEMTDYVEGGGGHCIKEELFSPTMICRQCIMSNMNNTYLNPDVQLRFRREMDDGTFIRSDVHIVVLILNKLIINACKFTRQGEITIGCNTTETPDCLTIYVQDTGVGMPEFRRDAMFEWFEHPGTTGDDEVEFDLSVAQKMALKIGGTLRYDAMYRDGTRMLLLLPVK